MSEASTVSTTEVKCESCSLDGASPVSCTPNLTITTHIPNRVFVGGIAASMTEAELFNVFAKFGRVRTARIIHDKQGRPKGYGFVTYGSESEARWVHDNMPNVYFGHRRLNVAPAMKKQVSVVDENIENNSAMACYGDTMSRSATATATATATTTATTAAAAVYGSRRRRGFGANAAEAWTTGGGGGGGGVGGGGGGQMYAWTPQRIPIVARSSLSVADGVHMTQFPYGDYSVLPALTTCRPYDYTTLPAAAAAAAVPPSTPNPPLCCGYPVPLPMPYLLVPQTPMCVSSGDRFMPPMYMHHPGVQLSTPLPEKLPESGLWKFISVPGPC